MNRIRFVGETTRANGLLRIPIEIVSCVMKSPFFCRREKANFDFLKLVGFERLLLGYS